ncbi:murein biosynthesis integral membrane protein MurJ [Acidiphilium sp. AL]|uniref:murein biosynthesis integral membrane protein MurJ n=1 Tax=Acidiphilium sp. AL TaxID=2871704 RepID=UPI0021CB1D55|nr:murein biosynthesis integral membrane protein MurJ [Acidiphilium sp. AL]MCU4158657.1 murein biosynthesis integral membrane protein MurJ [Acidiphilium sp. AL]
MIRNALTVGAWTMGSRVLGFLRDILIAAMLGAGPAADAFFVALRLPNLFRRLFGEGAFSAAFIPAYAGTLAHEGDVPARRLAEEIASIMVIGLFALMLLGMVFMPVLLDALAPGFRAEPAKFALAVRLSRITFPYLWLICLCALFAGVLNARGRFTTASAAPILFNICIIGALFVLHRAGQRVPEALAYGVALSGIVQFALLGRAMARAGVPLRLHRPRLTPGARIVLRRLGPGLIGAGVTQINLTVDTIIASLLPNGTVSVLYYADRVNQLPLGVIGAALATALLPSLSRQFRRGETEAARGTLNRAIEFGLLLTLPGAAALGAIGLPIMRTLFAHGAFSGADAARSAAALAAYAVGLPAFVLVKLFTPGFFARGDTKTPVKIGIGAVAINLGFNLALMHPLQQVGIALSTSIAAWFNVGMLAFLLAKRGDFIADARLTGRIARIAIACAVMAAGLLLLRGAGVMGWPAPLGLVLLVAGGTAIFALVGLAIGAFRVDELRILLRRPPPLDPAAQAG